MEMEGIIVNYRRGKRTVHPHQIILEFPEEKNPGSLIGRKVFWKSSSGKQLHGKIVALHGKKGAVRARFSAGLPGQALGGRVTLIAGEKKAAKKPAEKKKA
jgi:large subunit ribosomal protein L35Ae